MDYFSFINSNVLFQIIHYTLLYFIGGYLAYFTNENIYTKYSKLYFFKYLCLFPFTFILKFFRNINKK